MRNNNLKISLTIILIILTRYGISQCQQDSAITTLNNPVIINVLDNDTLYQGCIYTIDYSIFYSPAAPEHGTITILNFDSIMYTPDIGYIGNDNFIYGVNNEPAPSSACDTAKVFITVFENYLDLDMLNSGENDTLLVTSLPVIIDAGSGYSTYNWNTGDTTQTTLAEEEGWCTVDVSMGSRVLMTDSINVKLTLFNDDKISIPENLSIFPNPCNGLINIFNIEKTFINKIVILNMVGEKIYTDNFINKQNIESYDLSFLPKGMYLIKIESINKTFTSKLIIN